MPDDFFAYQSQRSWVKSLVVSNYYRQWGHIIAHGRGPGSNSMGYVDLFSGPGVYDDGTESTPLAVLRETLRSQTLSDRVQLVFNDKNLSYVSKLEGAIADAVRDESAGLRLKPRFSSFEVGPDTLDWFQQQGLGACLFFLDPWGYRGLSLDLISGLVRGWGSDCIFFFNYAALNMHLFNEGEDELVADFWGVGDLDELKSLLFGVSPRDSEYRAVDFLSSRLREQGVPYVVPMRFTTEAGDRTSYHLILASKNFRAYELMKEVMRSISTDQTETVVPFEFSVRYSEGSLQPRLLPGPVLEEDLSERLFGRFAGESLPFRDLYRSFEAEHTTPFLKRDYVAAIDKLRDQNLVNGGRRGGIRDDVIVSFPSQDERRRLLSVQASQQQLL